MLGKRIVNDFLAVGIFFLWLKGHFLSISKADMYFFSLGQNFLSGQKFFFPGRWTGHVDAARPLFERWYSCLLELLPALGSQVLKNGNQLEMVRCRVSTLVHLFLPDNIAMSYL